MSKIAANSWKQGSNTFQRQLEMSRNQELTDFTIFCRALPYSFSSITNGGEQRYLSQVAGWNTNSFLIELSWHNYLVQEWRSDWNNDDTRLVVMVRTVPRFSLGVFVVKT